MSQSQQELDYYQLAFLKSNLRMEKVGMKHSAQRGKALRPQLAEHFGLKPNDPHDKYIAEVQRRMDAILADMSAKE